MMMVALFLLFQGPQIIRERWNNYGVNPHAGLMLMSANNEWNEESKPSAGTVIFAGSENSESLKVIREWAKYAKRKVIVTDDIESVLQYANASPDLVVVDEALWERNGMESEARRILSNGLSVLFTRLPSCERIDRSPTAKAILGITEIYENEVTVAGIHLFPGFFIGGERIYQPVNETEEKLQDLELTMPWYRLGQRTETYMMGIIDDENYKNESMPGILWSCANGDAKVFAIEGDYFNDRMIGIGILDAAIAKIKDYYLYPCVNSQQFEVINYPYLANENSEELESIYSRSATGIFRNLVLPGLEADIAGNNFIVSGYIMPEYDYRDDDDPVKGELNYHLRKLGEQNGEACYSLIHNDSVDLDQKLKKDLNTFQEAPDYQFSAVYADRSELDEADEILSGYLTTVRTISTKYSPAESLVSFLPSGRTLQAATADVTKYTYTDDLEQMGAETALGYANIQMDLKNIIWPESEEDQWQNASREYFSIIDTYWKNYTAFEHTTASIADQKVRNLLCISYETNREGNDITVRCSGYAGSAEFILRTHNEKVTDVTNGSFRMIEDGAWLISVQSDVSHITIERDTISKG